MKLTSRRLWCGLLLLVCLITVALIDPIAKRAKQLAIRYAFDGQIAALDVHLHRRQEMLEIDGLSSVHVSDHAQVNVNADCALIKVDMPNLLDKRLISSKAKLHGMRIELASTKTTITPARNAPTNVQTMLDALLLQLNWDAFKSDCEALLTADDLLKELDAKMRGWLMRSQQIMFHADQLTSSLQAFSNPLRNMTEIRSQLKQIEQLRAEQDNLQKQFSSLATILPSLSQEIQAASQRDITALRAKSSRESDTLRAQFAERLLLDWTSRLLSRQQKLAQSISIVFNNSTTGNPHNVNVRELDVSPSVIRLSGIEADGVFIEASDRVPFVASGELAFSQQVNFQLAPQTSWSIQYQEANVGTELNLVSLPENGKWQIRTASHTCEPSSNSPSDRSSAAKSLADAMSQLDSQPRLFTIDAILTHDELTGFAKMNIAELDAFKKLPCASNADLRSITLAHASTSGTSAAATPANEEWIEFELAGTLFAPRVTLKSPLPHSVIDGLTDPIQQNIETQRTDCESKLGVAVNAKLSELKTSIENNVQQAQQTVAKQQELLADIHSKLEESLQSRESYEYARRPSAATSNR